MSSSTTKCEEHELIWSIFSSAATSYRADTLLRPFPPQFILEDGHKDIESLGTCVETMPSPSSGITPSSKQKALLQWLLQQPNMSVASKPLSKLKDIQELIGEKISISEPNCLFEINYTEQKEAAFKSCKGSRSTFYAYHGSKVENFYSIISHGLHSHLNKTSLYGEGTYLSTEPTVALGFSPWSSTGWKNSVMADSMSIVALCEVIDHPSVKLSTANGSSLGSHSSWLRLNLHLSKKCLWPDVTSSIFEQRVFVTDEARRRAPNSETGDNVPNNYIVVTNNDMVRVKYLLVYTKKASPLARQITSSNRRSVMLAHLHRHGHSLTMALYILLLIVISVLSSPKFWRKVRQVYEETMYDWVEPATDTL